MRNFDNGKPQTRLDNRKRRSRYDALFFRPTIIERAQGQCEVCGYLGHPILHIHHIVPVNEGGAGSPENLIALCPNCHVTVHRLRDIKEGDEIKLSWVERWIERTYTYKQMKMLGSIAFETLEHVDGKWVAHNSVFYWEEEA